jgi:hypothetical protein
MARVSKDFTLTLGLGNVLGDRILVELLRRLLLRHIQDPQGEINWFGSIVVTHAYNSSYMGHRDRRIMA